MLVEVDAVSLVAGTEVVADEALVVGYVSKAALAGFCRLQVKHAAYHAATTPHDPVSYAIKLVKYSFYRARLNANLLKRKTINHYRLR